MQAEKQLELLREFDPQPHCGQGPEMEFKKNIRI